MAEAPDPSDLPVVDNRDANRFELELDGRLAVSEYMRVGDTVIFTHTEVPEELEGQGVGGRLVRGALDRVRAEGLQVRATCPFVSRYIAEHPEYRELTVTVGREG